MKFTTFALFSILLLSSWEFDLVDGKKSSRPSSVSTRNSSRGRKAPSSGRRRSVASIDESNSYSEEDISDDPDFLGLLDNEEEEEEEYAYDEYDEAPRAKPSKSRSSSTVKSRNSKNSKNSRKRPSKPVRYEEEYDDDYDPYYEEERRPSRSRSGSRNSSRSGGRRDYPSQGRSSRGSSRGGRRSSSGRVVPYTRQTPSAFTRGLDTLKNTIPTATSIKDNAVGAMNAAKQTTSKLSKTVYREVKGLTSSELEQVMLKATRPDDTPVKGKHSERLVGVTYQISGRYDIYDSVLRKLWNKMTESDWRTKIKSLYILHRFSSDGAPDHQAALKARLRELRRTKDPKRKEKYFNSKQLLTCDATPENTKYRAFLSRYAHYVLLRAQCFGGMFSEISQENESSSSKKSSSNKPITSTGLRVEHLEAATLLLKSATACSLKDGEECEHTACAMERVAADMIGITSAVAVSLNKVLRSPEPISGVDYALIKRWCEFYAEELLPKTKLLVKKSSSKLDKYGLFLPSRMSASIRKEVLEKGLNYMEKSEEPEAEPETEPAESIGEKAEDESEVTGEVATKVEKKSTQPPQEDEEEDIEDDEEVDDEAKDDASEYEQEYDYEVEEYYDEE